jgi:hypothetical protein
VAPRWCCGRSGGRRHDPVLGHRATQLRQKVPFAGRGGRLAQPILVRQQGEYEGHAGSFAGPAVGLDASAVGLGDGLGYGEAEAVAGFVDAVEAVEALEDVRQLRLWYARSLIPDLDAQLAA